MQLLLNALIKSDNGHSQAQIEAGLEQWLSTNGYTVMQNHSFSLPDDLTSPTELGSGTAVFHNNYDIDNPIHSTHRRYFLSRCWDSSLPTMTLFGMNPSTASSRLNDPTVEFMMKVAKHNNCGSLFVINTSSYIKSSDTIGPDFVVDDETWEYIQFAVNQASVVILGWGENGQKYGIPNITSSYPLRGLLDANLDKLKAFGFGRINARMKFPKHPYPRTNKFKVDHNLLTLDTADFYALFPAP